MDEVIGVRVILNQVFKVLIICEVFCIHNAWVLKGLCAFCSAYYN